MYESRDYNSSKIYLLACTSSLGSLGWGYNVSVFNPLRVYLEAKVFPDASGQIITLMASMLTIGAAFGSFFAGNLSNKFGRHRLLVYNDFLGILSSCLCMIQSLPIIIIGRLLVGINIGVHIVVVSLYNVEMAPTQIKGAMGTISMAFMALGGLLAFAAAFFVPNIDENETSQVWRLIFGFAMIFNIVRLLMFLLVFKFETPFYLVLTNDLPGARNALKQVYNDNVETHLCRVMKDKEASMSNGDLKFIDLFSPKYINATLIVLLLSAGIQMSGFSPIFMFFNVLIQDSANNDPEILSLFATLIGVISFIFTVVTVLIIERFGRKPLLIVGMFLNFVVEALYAIIGFTSGSSNPSLNYILLFWPVFFRISVGSLGFLYSSEVLPAIGVSFSVVTNWIVAFIVVQSFFPLVNTIGVEGVLLILALSCLISSILYKYYLIESKGRTKAELLELYNKDKKDGDIVEMKRIPLINSDSL